MRVVLITLLGAVALVGAVGAGIVAASRPRVGPAHPAGCAGSHPGTILVDKVPSTLPPHGVSIFGVHTLLPPPTGFTPAVTSARAIVLARTYDDGQRQYPATVLLAIYTDECTIPPPGDHGRYDTIQNVPAWVVTFTAPTPYNVAIGACCKPPRPIMVTHMNAILNARTGVFLRGFFTK